MGFRKLGQLRGSFEHECFFYFLLTLSIRVVVLKGILLMHFVAKHTGIE